MQEVAGHAFALSPLGRFAASSTWVCFCPDASLVATVLWGHIDEEQLHALCDAVPETHCASLAPHAYLLDVRDVQSLDPWLLPGLKQYLHATHATYARLVTRIAIVRPRDLLAATVAEGFFSVFPAPCPVRVFTGAEEALEWLGAESSVALELVDAVTMVRATSRLSAQLRELLEHEGASTPIGKVARKLGVSPRTLQRRLRLEGTSFRDEVNVARLRAAQRLLTESRASIAEIAFEVGYASPAHLSEWFRRRMGESPSQWREKRRSAPP